MTRVDRFHHRLAGEVDHSNRPVIARMVAATLDDALRSDDAPAALELDLSSLRFLDVAGAVGLVHAAEEFPEAHRLSLTGVRPGVLRALDRCGAPFAAQLDVTAHLGVSPGFRCPATQGGRGARVPPPARAPTAHPAASRPAGFHPPRAAPPRTATASPAHAAEPRAAEPRAAEQWVAPW